MPTKLISKALLGTLSAAVMAAPAFAGGNCGGGSCAVPVQVLPYAAPQFGPVTIQNQNPLGHLSSIHFQRAPNVSITRIHGLAPTAGLSDVPSGFTGGCHPSSTTYCRQSAGTPVQVELNAPVSAPSFSAPVFSAPAQSTTVHTGGGYDASKFTPRVYGDASFVPGIAYLPTSTVVRDPAAAQQVLDTGRAVPQPVVVPGTGTAPNPGFVQQPNFVQQHSFTQQNRSFQSAPVVQNSGLSQSQGLFLAPTRQGPSFGQPGVPLLQESGPFAGSFGSNVAADGTYWEKVSGPTAFGDTVATTVICKRKIPTRAVRPVVGVPVPVRVPVAVPQTCQTVGHEGLRHAPHGPVAVPNGHFGHAAPGRWIQ